MTTALILFAHGARDPEWAGPMRRVQAALRERCPALPVELAFLEFIPPDLSDCVAALTAEGADRICIVPMFIAQGGHLKRELPEMLERLRHAHPGVQFSLSGPIGEQESVVQAMAAAARELAGL
jgi:sirohydrochlorin cobaltochelatase